MRDDEVRLRRQQRYRLEVAQRIVWHFGFQIGHDRERGLARHKERIAVRRRLDRELGADDRAGTRPVVDEELLRRAARQLVDDRARDDVIAAAGRVGHDYPHRFRRIRLRGSRRAR